MSDDPLEAKTGSGAVNCPRLQHYVPQFLLRRFTDSAGRLGVFDKAADRSFSTGTRAVAADAFFYDVELDGDVLTLEPSLAELERVASGVIDQIHTRQSLSHLSSKDRGTLAAFIAVQAFRTQHQRTNILHLARSLVDRINRAVPDDQPEARLPSPTEEDASRIERTRAAMLESLHHALKDLLELSHEDARAAGGELIRFRHEAA